MLLNRYSKNILISPPFILIKTFSPCFYSDFVDVCVCVCVCVTALFRALVIFFQRIKVDFHEIPITVRSVLANGHPRACWGMAEGWGEHRFRSQWNWPQSPTPTHNFAVRTWGRHLISWVAVLIPKCSQCLHEAAHRKHLALHSPWTYFQIYYGVGRGGESGKCTGTKITLEVIFNLMCENAKFTHFLHE